jgi:CHASE2 domain-containing sensor protein
MVEHGDRSDQAPGPTARRRGWLSRRLRVTFALERASDSRLARATTLLVIVALAFAIVGTVRTFTPMRALASSPVNFDLALRTVSAGWFQPRDIIPVAVVEIDQATHEAWGNPPVTPRDRLVALIDRVVEAAPAAVIVDIDLGWGGEDPGLPLLTNFLASYSGPPLLFPRRIDPAPGGNRKAASSPLDPVFAANPHLAWAHASFETDSGGKVRQWADWIEVCSDDGTYQLPSIPARLSLMLDPLPAGLARASPPHLTGSCRRPEAPRAQLLLIGPRFTGPEARRMTRDAAAVSALTVLDPELDRDDAWLFGDRVVLIGATYSASGDFWLTPSGVVPGVEMVGHTVRFASLRSTPGWRADLAFRAAALAGFVLIALISIWLVGLAAAVALIAGTLLFVSVPIWLWNYYRVFEALEVAVLLFVFYKFAQISFDTFEDWGVRRELYPPGWRGWLRTAWSVCHRSGPKGGES